MPVRAFSIGRYDIPQGLYLKNTMPADAMLRRRSSPASAPKPHAEQYGKRYEREKAVQREQ
jgi:hypothetical protein